MQRFHKSRPLPEVVNRFELETMFHCTSLEDVYIDGIYVRPSLYDTIEP
jgi:hypothetical protein